MIMDDLAGAELRRLKAGGFARSGIWQRDGIDPPICKGAIPSKGGIYVFVQRAMILYVGTAQKGLRRRMKTYQRRQRDPSSHGPVETALTQAVGISDIVEIFTRVVTPASNSIVDGLPIDNLIGLQAGLVAEFRPPWNRQGRNLIVDDIES